MRLVVWVGTLLAATVVCVGEEHVHELDECDNVPPETIDKLKTMVDRSDEVHAKNALLLAVGIPHKMADSDLASNVTHQCTHTFTEGENGTYNVVCPCKGKWWEGEIVYNFAFEKVENGIYKTAAHSLPRLKIFILYNTQDVLAYMGCWMQHKQPSEKNRIDMIPILDVRASALTHPLSPVLLASITEAKAKMVAAEHLIGGIIEPRIHHLKHTNNNNTLEED